MMTMMMMMMMMMSNGKELLIQEHCIMQSVKLVTLFCSAI